MAYHLWPWPVTQRLNIDTRVVSLGGVMLIIFDVIKKYVFYLQAPKLRSISSVWSLYNCDYIHILHCIAKYQFIIKSGIFTYHICICVPRMLDTSPKLVHVLLDRQKRFASRFLDDALLVDLLHDRYWFRTWRESE